MTVDATSEVPKITILTDMAVSRIRELLNPIANNSTDDPRGKAAEVLDILNNSVTFTPSPLNGYPVSIPSDPKPNPLKGWEVT